MEISCVVPTYEHLHLASRAILSASAQTAVEAEVIVCDDSKTTAVRDFVRSFGRPGDSLRHFAGPRTGNPVDNWNFGLDQARAPVRVVLHHDEWFADHAYLRKALDRLAASGAPAVVSRTRVGGKSKFGFVSAIARSLGGPRWLLPSINWVGPTAAFVFSGDHRFDRDFVWLADVEFYLRVSAAGRLAFIDGPAVGSTGRHPGQITASLEMGQAWRRDLALLESRHGGALSRSAWAFNHAVATARKALHARSP
ncbi:MAG: glycosyltransferase family 2 protein [Caulobacteraceae bacterium]